MRYALLALLLNALVMLSCGQDKKEAAIPEGTSTEVTDSVLKKELDNSIITFLNWYDQHIDKLAAIALVNNASLVQEDTTKYYSVNFKNTEKYLKVLQQSGLFSPKYMADKRLYFKECQHHFEQERQYDGPPSGFDYDLVMKAQDFDRASLVQHYKAKNIVVNHNTARLTADFDYGYQLQFTLSKVGDVWIIDDITNAGK